jgi:endonuclease/exonuclease/phosphatase family metal-dependent hydrolase
MARKLSILKNCVLACMLVNGLAVAGYSQTLTVCTFNLRGDDPNDVGNLWADRKLLVKAQIEKYQFDLVGLQETKAAMAGYIKSVLPRFDSLGIFNDATTGMLYNTERLLLQNHGHFWLSPTPDSMSKGWDAKFKRACVWAQFKDRKTGLNFYAFNTHFDHVGVVARTNSVVLVRQKIAQLAGATPTIFMGDLNISQYDSNYIVLNN